MLSEISPVSHYQADLLEPALTSDDRLMSAFDKAVRTEIRLKSNEPFAIACLWDRWKQPETGELIVSFSMLTVNADEHPVMKRFHKAGDEKRTPVIVPESQYFEWLGASIQKAEQMLSLQHIPALHAD